MEIRIKSGTDVPIYQQIVDAVQEQISSGVLAEGQKLPTVRQLAEEMGLAKGTIKRAYDELERCGAIRMTQGKGTFVLELRRRDTYRPELELVAEENGQLIGHILLTILPVPGAPEGLRGLMVAPLCVRLEDRSRGLGGQLLQEGGRRAAELGYNALFLVGDPDYYGRYGFQNAVSLGFQNASGVPDQFLLALGLTPDALQNAGGALALH